MLWATGTPRRRREESSTSSTLDGVVSFDILQYYWEGTHKSEAVCNMPTTFVIMERDFSGTCNQALNAEIMVALMSFPGCSNR